MKRLALVAILAAVGLTACGGGSTTTVIEQAPTTTETTTTTEEVVPEPTTDEWPPAMQEKFLEGCGAGYKCACGLDAIQKAISAEELAAAGNDLSQFRDEVYAAAQECAV